MQMKIHQNQNIYLITETVLKNLKCTMLTIKCNLKFLSKGKNVKGLAGFELVTCR